MKLYAVLLGGRAQGCNTELHDVVFAVGAKFEDTYPQLVKKWFGIHKRLHVDSFIELDSVDGYKISLSDKAADNHGKKLFFVNFGGYRPNFFGEIHEANFYIANTKPEILAKAKKDLGLTLTESHCDDNVEIDDVFAVDKVDQYFIQLTPTSETSQLKIVSKYRKLDVQGILGQTLVPPLP